MRNPDNYPGFVVIAAPAVEGGVTSSLAQEEIEKENERILRKAVGKGRYVSLLLPTDDPFILTFLQLSD